MGSIKSTFQGGAAALALWALAVGTASAQSRTLADRAEGDAASTEIGTEIGDAPRCVTLNTISNGEVLSGQEVYFELRDGTALVAALARDCPQLKFHGSFTYQAVAGRLCAGEGRIVARSGEACLINEFSLATEPATPPNNQSSDLR